MINNSGGPAFPVPGVQLEDEYGRKETIGPRQGVSLRDYFAARAMQGMISDRANVARFQELADEGSFTAETLMAIAAYQMADEMIAVRAK